MIVKVDDDVFKWWKKYVSTYLFVYLTLVESMKLVL
jgi:hypothetical protein